MGTGPPILKMTGQKGKNTMKKLIEAIKNLFHKEANTDFFEEFGEARDYYSETPACCRIRDRAPITEE